MRFHLASASYPVPATRRLTYVKYAAAAIFVILALAQLFAFEKMGAIIGAELRPGLHDLGKLLATAIVVLEVAAVPGFLNIALSPAARYCSRVASVVVWVVWYFVILGGMLTNRIVNSGILGDKIDVPAHFATLILVMIVCCGMIVVQYFDVRRTHLSKTTKSAKIR